MRRHILKWMHYVMLKLCIKIFCETELLMSLEDFHLEMSCGFHISCPVAFIYPLGQKSPIYQYSLVTCSIAFLEEVRSWAVIMKCLVYIFSNSQTVWSHFTSVTTAENSLSWDRGQNNFLIQNSYPCLLSSWVYSELQSLQKKRTKWRNILKNHVFDLWLRVCLFNSSLHLTLKTGFIEVKIASQWNFHYKPSLLRF